MRVAYTLLAQKLFRPSDGASLTSCQLADGQIKSTAAFRSVQKHWAYDQDTVLGFALMKSEFLSPGFLLSAEERPTGDSPRSFLGCSGVLDSAFLPTLQQNRC